MNQLFERASKNLSKEASENLEKWLTEDKFLQYKEEIISLIKEEDWEELEDAFYTHVRIGTGGIRGRLGAGPNRINLRTIGEAAQGLSQFIEDFGEGAKKKGVIVGREVRKHSEEFAVLCCEVLAANGIKSFLFDDIRATPEISFAVRHLKAIAGIELTASHNPRTDNGFKFFWTDGGQVVPPLDQKFMNLVLGVREIKRIDFSQAKNKGLIKIIGEEIDDEYFKKIRELSLVKTRSAKIAFSPIHGVGSTNALPILKQEGFDVAVVPEQAESDENFPTAYGDFINPEYKEVLESVIKLAEKIDTDVAICSDPDACRIGAGVKTDLSSKKIVPLTGNELGVAMVYFILSLMKERGRLRKKENLVTETSVTTSLISDITKSFGIKIVDDLLVGFKWIGQIVEHLKNQDDFVFAFEESLGYLRGNFIRDKCAAIAAFTLAEMVSWLKDQNKTVADYLNEIYQKYGYYRNILNMVDMVGKIGFEDIVKYMVTLRADPPKELAGFRVLKVIDRLDPEMRNPKKYIAGFTGDQVTLILSEDGRTKFTARPSGTQPQLKYYFQHYGRVDGNLEQVKKEVDTVANNLEKAAFEYQDKALGKKVPGHSFKSNW